MNRAHCFCRELSCVNNCAIYQRVLSYNFLHKSCNRLSLIIQYYFLEFPNVLLNNLINQIYHRSFLLSLIGKQVDYVVQLRSFWCASSLLLVSCLHL